jgi:hypothetical protein
VVNAFFCISASRDRIWDGAALHWQLRAECAKTEPHAAPRGAALLSSSPMSIYRRVLLYYRPFGRPTLLALAISLVTIGLNLAKPWPFQIIVDHFLT